MNKILNHFTSKWEALLKPISSQIWTTHVICVWIFNESLLVDSNASVFRFSHSLTTQKVLLTIFPFGWMLIAYWQWSLNEKLPLPLRLLQFSSFTVISAAACNLKSMNKLAAIWKGKRKNMKISMSMFTFHDLLRAPPTLYVYDIHYC